jgi:hypothetical protein
VSMTREATEQRNVLRMVVSFVVTMRRVLGRGRYAALTVP